MPAADPVIAGSRLARVMWFGAGWSSVGVGAIGIVVPGLPTTVFFVVAASCFARSSPRFERWVLELPHIGPLVCDYRAGLGMSRRAKAMAVATMVVFAALGVVFGVDHPLIAGGIGVLVAIGAWYVITRVPTRETELARRAALDTGPDGLQRPLECPGTPSTHGFARDSGASPDGAPQTG